MKRLIPLFLILCLAAALPAQVNPYFQGTFDQARAEAGQSGRQLIVFYYSDG